MLQVTTTHQKGMSLSINVSFSMACRTKPKPVKDWNVQSFSCSKERLNYPPDATERDLSPAILDLQRRVREEMRKSHSLKSAQYHTKKKVARSQAERQPKAVLHDKRVTFERRSTDGKRKAAIEDDWNLLDLSDVEPVDLEKMDLTGLAPSLLESVKGDSLDYTEEERTALQALLEKRDDRGRVPEGGF
ncbi:hypothetical protein Q7P37_011304 [Cladosporium fusiforme]